VDEIIGEFIGAFVRGILGANLHAWMIVIGGVAVLGGFAWLVTQLPHTLRADRRCGRGHQDLNESAL
jgi:hypothetical protein